MEMATQTKHYEESPHQLLEQKELVGRMRLALNILTPREQLVITERFGLDGNNTRTLKDIGARLMNNNGKLGVTGNRVRMIQNHAMRKIRHSSRTRLLRAFINPDHLYQWETKETK